MIDYYETKQHPVTRKMVWDAYKKVRENKGSAGVDEQAWRALPSMRMPMYTKSGTV
jgi:hypothetical protein